MEKRINDNFYAKQSSVVVNYVGVLFGLLVLALTTVKPDDYEGVFIYLQFEYFLAVYFLLMSIVIGFWFILNMPLNIWNLFKCTIKGRFRYIFKNDYIYDPEIIRVFSIRWKQLLLMFMYGFFLCGLVVVASIIVLMVFKSLSLNFVFLGLIAISSLSVFYYIDKEEE